jgi:hypothetical protein
VRWGGHAAGMKYSTYFGYDADQAISASTFTELNGASQFTKNIGGNQTTNPWSWTPSESGYYFISVRLEPSALASWTINQASEVFIKVNTTTYQCLSSWRAERTALMYPYHLLAAGIIYANASDVIKIVLWHNATGGTAYYWAAQVFGVRIR